MNFQIKSNFDIINKSKYNLIFMENNENKNIENKNTEEKTVSESSKINSNYDSLKINDNKTENDESIKENKDNKSEINEELKEESTDNSPIVSPKNKIFKANSKINSKDLLSGFEPENSDDELSVDETFKIDDNAKKIKPVTGRNLTTKNKKKSSKKKPIIVAIIVILICLLSIGAAWAYSFLNTSFDDEEADKINEELSQANFDEPFYMILIGTDTREHGSYKLTDGRSDSCIVVRIDPVTFTVTLISIPRDTKITTSDGYICKFNELYATGGVSATIKQVKKMLDIDIAHYAEVSFNGLSDMIDAVGGVEVDVPEEIDDPKSGAYVPKGLNLLNGEQALSFSRSRNFADGDFTREADQRILIKALIYKAFNVGTSGLPNLLKAAKNFVKTDLRLGDMIGLASQFMMSDQETKIYQTMLPVLNAGENGISYVKLDIPGTKRMMKMVENGEDPSMVELDSGASVGSSRDAQELAKKQKEYYAQHPDSPGKISNSKEYSSKNNSSYSDNEDYNSSDKSYNNTYQY